MTMTGTVKSISENSAYAHVEVVTDDKVTIDLRFEMDDPRVSNFGFRQQIVIELRGTTLKIAQAA